VFDRIFEMRAPKENETKFDFCRNQTNSINKANNMQQTNVIIRCYAKSMKVCFPNQNIMQYNMQQPHVLLCCYANWKIFVV
jgi:hypothetical protein